jgi:hypothetical protein
MVGCNCHASGTPLRPGYVPAPKRDLSPAGPGHYRGLFQRSHYHGLYAPPRPQRRSIRCTHPISRRRRSLSGLGDSTAGFPAGSIFRYSASWPNTPLPTAVALAATPYTPTVSPQQVYQAIGSVLISRWGISVSGMTPNASGILTSTLGFTIQGTTNSDYGAAADVKSIIDGEIYNATGSMPVSSIAVVQADAGVPIVAPTPTAPFDLPTFLSDNWPVLAIAGLGVLVAKELF